MVPFPLPGFLRALLLWLLTLAVGAFFIFCALLLGHTSQGLAEAFAYTLFGGYFAGLFSLVTVPFVYLLFRWVGRLASLSHRWLTAALALTVFFLVPAAAFVGGNVIGIRSLWQDELLRHALLYLPAVWLCAAGLYHPWLNRPTPTAG